MCYMFGSEEIAVKTVDGFHQLSVPMVSRRDSCRFTLQPYANTLGDFFRSIREEDKAIQQVHAENEGNSLSSCVQNSLSLLFTSAVKGLFTLSQNEAETAGMGNFQNSRHIRAGMSCKRNFSKNAVRILRIRCEPGSNDSCAFRVY